MRGLCYLVVFGGRRGCRVGLSEGRGKGGLRSGDE